MLPDATPFLDRLFAWLGREGVEVAALELDHLCYRVETPERYAALKEHLQGRGRLLGEHLIGGRPIATFLLDMPIQHGDRRIAVVELSAPKSGSPYSEGWEHAEFVVHEGLEEFAQRHPQVRWGRSGLTKAYNPELRCTYEAISAKFHRQALAELIANEQRDPVA